MTSKGFIHHSYPLLIKLGIQLFDLSFKKKVKTFAKDSTADYTGRTPVGFCSRG